MSFILYTLVQKIMILKLIFFIFMSSLFLSLKIYVILLLSLLSLSRFVVNPKKLTDFSRIWLAENLKNLQYKEHPLKCMCSPCSTVVKIKRSKISSEQLTWGYKREIKEIRYIEKERKIERERGTEKRKLTLDLLLKGG